MASSKLAYRYASFMVNSILKFQKIVANIFRIDFALESRFQPLLGKSDGLVILGYSTGAE